MSPTSLTVGIVKEIKPGEFRVAGRPEHVRLLRALGSRVVVQAGAGARAGWSDADYRDAGAELAADGPAVYAAADLVWKVKEILPAEFGLVRAGQILFTYLHAAPRREMTEALLHSGCVAIAYEEMTDDEGRRPLLAPMSRLAGAGAVALAAQFSQALYGGSGKLLFATEGADPVGVTILGGGIAGCAAARAALGAGADVHILEPLDAVRRRLAESFPGATIGRSGAESLDRRLPRTDILFHCTLWMPGDPPLLTRGRLALMPPGSLIMDVAADPGGGIETSVETTHDDPLRVVDGILHYCVQNIPSLFSKTASQALSDATWPFLEAMVRQGLGPAVRSMGMLRRGVAIWYGRRVGASLGRCQNADALEPDALLADLPAG